MQELPVLERVFRHIRSLLRLYSYLKLDELIIGLRFNDWKLKDSYMSIEIKKKHKLTHLDWRMVEYRDQVVPQRNDFEDLQGVQLIG